MTAGNDMQGTPPPKKVRVGRLDTLAGVRAELGRVYRESRRGEMHPNIGTKLAFILQALQKSIELEVIEQRLKALEERAGK